MDGWRLEISLMVDIADTYESHLWMIMRLWISYPIYCLSSFLLADSWLMWTEKQRNMRTRMWKKAWPHKPYKICGLHCKLPLTYVRFPSSAYPRVPSLLVVSTPCCLLHHCLITILMFFKSLSFLGWTS